MREGQPQSIAAVIVNYRTPELTEKCLNALEAARSRLPDLRAIVVDGGSGDSSSTYLANLLATPQFAGWVTFLPLSLNGGFGWANNQAMLRLLQSENPPTYIYLLNPDTMVEPDAIAALTAVLNREPRCGAAGSLLLNLDGTISGSAFRFPSATREFVRGAKTALIGRILGIQPLVVERDVAAPVDWVTGASVMLRTAALKECGLFDDGFFLYFEEVELMWRMRQRGWSIWHAPDSRVTHVGGASTGMNDNDAVTSQRPARPGYWFASRRRFFGRTSGKWGATMATLCWLAGHLLWRIRQRTGLAGTTTDTVGEARGLIRHGIVPTKRDLSPFIASWIDEPQRAPAWMIAPE